MLESCETDDTIKPKPPEDTLDEEPRNDMREKGNACRGEAWTDKKKDLDETGDDKEPG